MGPAAGLVPASLLLLCSGANNIPTQVRDRSSLSMDSAMFRQNVSPESPLVRYGVVLPPNLLIG